MSIWCTPCQSDRCKHFGGLYYFNFGGYMKRIQAQRRVPYVDNLPSKTDQSFRKEVNVNSIMAKYFKTRQIDLVKAGRGRYMDVSAIPDLMGAFDKVHRAEKAFSELPAVVRERLGNNPANMTDFVLDPKNEDLLREYGMLTPKAAGSGETAVSAESAKARPAKPASKKSRVDGVEVVLDPDSD